MEIHDLQYKDLTFLQDDACFRFGTDAVLLASFVRVRRGELCVDLGAGTGILPVLISARTGARVAGIEIQSAAAALARENARCSGLPIEIIEGDMAGAAELIKEPVAAVVANPPYQRPGSMEPASIARKTALHEGAADIALVARAAASLLKTGGKFFMIHRTERLAEVMCALCAAGLEPKRLRMIEPRAGERSKLFLTQATRGAAPGILPEPPLVIYGADGEYTAELKKIYHQE